MADLDFEFDQELEDCPDCDKALICCDDGCDLRIAVAPCGSITEDGDIPDYSAFCEPQSWTDFTWNFTRPTRRKPYRARGCAPQYVRGNYEYGFSVTTDICQDDPGTCLLLGDCPFDILTLPKAINFNGDFRPEEMQTPIIYGRAIGNDLSWNFPEDECQNATVDYNICGRLFRHGLWQALLPNAG